MNNPNTGNFYDNQKSSQYDYMEPEYDIYPNNSYSDVGRPPENNNKNNNNTLMIILISVVALLLCAIIALTVVLIVKSNTDTPQQTPDGLNGTQTQQDAQSAPTKHSTPTYVTCVSDAQIFVRSGPGKSNSIVLKINGGDTSVKLKSTGNTTTASDGYMWYEVTIPSGQTAWVRSDVVTMDGPDPYQRPATSNTTPVTVTSSNVLVTKSYISRIFVRSGPSKSYPVIYIIQPGDKSKKLITTGGAQYDSSGYVWYQVYTPANQLAWVRNDVVTADTSKSGSTYRDYYTSPGATLVTKSSISRIFVRSGPSKSYKVVYIIAAGDTSKKLITTGVGQYDSSGYFWYQVRTPQGQVAWVRNDVVTFESAKPTSTSTSGISVSSGTTLVTKSYKSVIYVRSGPGKSYKVVYKIAAGDTSKKLITTGTAQYDSSGYLWYQVRTPQGQIAWVRNDIVTSQSSGGGSTGNGKQISVGSGTTLVTKSYNSVIYVRSGPGKSYNVVYKIYAGDTSKKLITTGVGQYDSSGYLWYQVRTPQGQVAWVRNDIVTSQSSGGGSSSGSSSSGSGGTLVTKSYASKIYVRSGPSKSYNIVYTIAAGDTSKKLAYTGNSQRGGDGYIWYNVITPSGSNAWVRSDIVQFQ